CDSPDFRTSPVPASDSSRQQRIGRMLPRDYNMHGHSRRTSPHLLMAIALAVILPLHVGAILLLTGGFGGLVRWRPIFYAAIGLLVIIAVFHGIGFWRSRTKGGS